MRATPVHGRPHVDAAPHRPGIAARSYYEKEDEVGIIGWVLLGLIAGAIAKALHPGEREPGGVLGTLLVGVLGALLGGLIASALGVGAISSFFSLGTWLIAIGGALLFVTIWNALAARRGEARI
jgi:uncharacterized membrane protein YeaQ/YmgE (transglycosylase-associated protein family)